MNRFIVLVWIVILVFFGNVTIYSQNSEADETENYDAIPLSKIPDFQVQATAKFYEFNRFNSDTSSYTILKKDLDKIKQTIDFKTKELDSINISKLNTDQLQQWDRLWLDLDRKLGMISDPIDDKLERYDVYYNDINDLYQVWLETSISIKKSDIPANLKTSVSETKQEARKLRGDCKDSEAAFLSLKHDCTEQSNKISEKRNLISKARENIVKNLLVAEQPVLWKAYQESKNDTLAVQKSHSLQTAIENINTYVKRNPNFIYGFVFVFIIFLIIMVYVQKYLKQEQIIEQLQRLNANLFVLKKPVLISVIVAWISTVTFYYLPIEIGNFIFLIMIPLILVLFIGVFGKQKPHFIAIFSLFIVFKTTEFLFNTEVFIVGLGFIVFAIFTAYVYWLMLNKTNLSQQFKKFGWLYRFVMYVSMILVSVAALLLIIGNVYLGKMLLVGSISILLSGILIYAGYKVFMSIIQILLMMPYAIKSNIIKKHARKVEDILRKILSLGFFFLWASAALNNFAIKNEVLNFFNRIYSHQFEIGSTSFGLNSIVAFIIAIYASIYISRIILLILNEEVFVRSKTDKGMSSTITMLLRYSMISLGFLFALAAAGIELEKISIIIGALGVGIGFGLQNIFNNLFSGIILALERPVKVDDIIQVGELTGVVKQIGFRASTVRTYDGSDVIVPNGDIISNQMINWTHSDRKRRLKIDLGVSYDSDPSEVLEILREVTESHPMVEDNPAPRPRFLGFGDSTLDFQLLFWISDFDNSFGVGTEVTVNLHNLLKERGIKIPYPKRDITIVNKTEKE